jgi:hypothetical protein
MTLKYTNVADFWKFLGVNKNVMFAQPGTTPSRETVASTPVAAGKYYLVNPGVNKDTLTLYVGNTSAALTETTHYTFDSETNEIVLNSTGASYVGSTQNMTAGYQYTLLADVVGYDQTVATLETNERAFEDDTNTVFADQALTTPVYDQINEEAMTSVGWNNNIYNLDYFPVVKLHSTVTAAYTTGGTTLQIASGTGFPATGTIYVDGNEVSYTSKAGNILTVPSITPTIASGGVVRGEVLKVTLDAPGSTPTYQVLTPEIDYLMDYDTGSIQILGDFYLNLQYANTRPAAGYFDRMRATYLQAWHEPGKPCELPSDIVQAVYYMSAQDLQMRTILKAGVNALENFNPNSTRAVEEYIKSKTSDYSCVRISRC